MVKFSLVGFVHVAHLNDRMLCKQKWLRICEIIQNPFTRFQPSEIFWRSCFLFFLFGGGAEVQKSQTQNGKVLMTLSSDIFSKQESSTKLSERFEICNVRDP